MSSKSILVILSYSVSKLVHFRDTVYFLKQLSRAGIPTQQLLHFYTTVIRPVLGYASPVWDHSITRAQSSQLKSIQQRALVTCL